MRSVYTDDPDMKLVETSGYPYFLNSYHLGVSKHSQVERVGGIEPPSPAWKAGVIAFIRYPQAIGSKKIWRSRSVLLQSSVGLLTRYTLLTCLIGAKYNAPSIKVQYPDRSGPVPLAILFSPDLKFVES